MKIKGIIWIVLALLISSCNITKVLSGKTFEYKSKNRKLQIVFNNDSICQLKNVFLCNDIDFKFKEITITCNYKRDHDTLYLKNINCKDANCSYDLTIYIPPQESQKCSFLSEKNRKTTNFVGPSYVSEYQKYGLVPNIDIDTLYIIKNKILLYKYNEIMSIGYYFK